MSETREHADVCIFTHIAAGAFVGSLAPTPVLAPVFGLGSHIALDILPHYDIESIRLEILFGCFVLAVLVIGGARSLSILLGAGFGALPDLENLLWKTGVIEDGQKFFPGHVGVFRHGREAGLLNLIMQIIASVIMVAALLREYA